MVSCQSPENYFPVIFTSYTTSQRAVSIECVHGGHVGGLKQSEDICIKIEYISQRKIIVLFRSFNMAVVHTLYYRDLKQRRRRRQRERQKTIVLIRKTLALHVHYTLWYIFFVVLCKITT